jgi:hypothetical protein
MTVWMRWWKRAINFFCCVRQKDETLSFQYRIPPREEQQRTISRWFSLVEDAIVVFTRFINRANFLVVMLLCIVLYFVQIFIFTIFIHLIVAAYMRNQGVDCLTGFSYQGDVMDSMIRSFDLSWTTYSTVVSVTDWNLDCPVHNEALITLLCCQYRGKWDEWVMMQVGKTRC